VDSGRNSSLIELSDDHVLVLRVTAHHVPTVKPLEQVHDQIRDDLKRARAEELAEQASQAFLAANPGPERRSRGARRAAERLLERAGLDRAHERDRADRGARGRVRVAEAGAGPGDARARCVGQRKPRGPRVVERAGWNARLHPSSERDQRQRQLADQSANSELTGYVGTLREQATVRIPQDVIEPQQY
jgi:peptidyl-prolyl cis-trans isomerase D